MDIEALKYFKKAYGDNAVDMGSEIEELERISTGIIALDILYNGGIPKGRILEIYGGNSLGKTTTALHILAAMQRAGHICGYIDAEKTLTKEHCLLAGVDLDQLFRARPKSGDEAFNIMRDLCVKFNVTFIVVDSIPMMISSSQMEKVMSDAGNQTMGGVSALMSRMCPLMVELGREVGLTVLCLNQVRAKIGPVPGKDTPGGYALKHAYSHRIEITHAKQKGEGDIESYLKVVKSKVKGAGRQGTLRIIGGKIHKGICLVETAKSFKLILGSTWLKFSPEMAELTGIDRNLGNGADKTAEFILNNPEVYELLYNKCLELATGQADPAEDLIRVGEEDIADE